MNHFIFKLLLISFLVLQTTVCPTSRSFVSCKDIKQDRKSSAQGTIDMNSEIEDYADPGPNPRHDPRCPPHVQLTIAQNGFKTEEEIKRDYKSSTQGTIGTNVEIKNLDDPRANPHHDP